MKKTPEFPLKKKQKMMKNLDIHYVFKKVKIKLEMYATGTCTKKIKVLCIICIKF